MLQYATKGHCTSSGKNSIPSIVKARITGKAAILKMGEVVKNWVSKKIAWVEDTLDFQFSIVSTPRPLSYVASILRIFASFSSSLSCYEAKNMANEMMHLEFLKHPNNSCLLSVLNA